MPSRKHSHTHTHTIETERAHGSECMYTFTTNEADPPSSSTAAAQTYQPEGGNGRRQIPNRAEHVTKVFCDGRLLVSATCGSQQKRMQTHAYGRESACTESPVRTTLTLQNENPTSQHDRVPVRAGTHRPNRDREEVQAPLSEKARACFCLRRRASEAPLVASRLA